MDFKVAGTAGRHHRPADGHQDHGRLRPTCCGRRWRRRARPGCRILASMAEALAEPRAELSPYAPQVLSDQDRLRPDRPHHRQGRRDDPRPRGGVRLQDRHRGGRLRPHLRLERRDAARAAAQRIEEMTRPIGVGTSTATASVVKTAEFGAFIEIRKGTDGLLHVSRISPGVRIDSDRPGAARRGDIVTVEVTEVDTERGRIAPQAGLQAGERRRDHGRGDRRPLQGAVPERRPGRRPRARGAATAPGAAPAPAAAARTAGAAARAAVAESPHRRRRRDDECGAAGTSLPGRDDADASAAAARSSPSAAISTRRRSCWCTGSAAPGARGAGPDGSRRSSGVVALDLPGFGRSPPLPGGGFDLERVGAALPRRSIAARARAPAAGRALARRRRRASLRRRAAGSGARARARGAGRPDRDRRRAPVLAAATAAPRRPRRDAPAEPPRRWPGAAAPGAALAARGRPRALRAASVLLVRGAARAAPAGRGHRDRLRRPARPASTGSRCRRSSSGASTTGSSARGDRAAGRRCPTGASSSCPDRPRAR